MTKSVEEMEAELFLLRGQLAEARQEAARWRLMAENAPDYLVIVDEELRFQWVNRVHPAVTQEEVIGEELAAFAPASTMEKARWSVRRALTELEGSVYVGWANVRGDERLFETRVVPLTNATALLATRDITEEHRAKQALLASERVSRALIDNYPDVLLVLDAGGRVVATNDLTARRMGTTREELLGTVAFDRMDPEVAARRRSWLKQLCAERGLMRLEDEHRGRVYDSVAFVLSSPDEPVEQIAVISRDVTEARQVDEMLRQREARHWHSEKMEALGTLASGIAHDVNNALTPILSSAKLAGSPAIGPSLRAELLGQIERGAERAAALVQQILGYARRTPVERSLIDLRVVVHEAERFVRTSLPVSVALRCELPVEQSFAWVSSGQVHQAIVNLCINAIQEMADSGGTLTLALATRTVAGGGPEPVELSPGDYRVITVRDTGEGIDPGAVPRIFDPFFSTKAPDRGSGLGLFMVDGVARAHGGAITVESQLGVGSTFSLWLPTGPAKS